MSTRCQVKVNGLDESVTLYHHCDGYPENMIPLIKQAFDFGNKSWKLTRAGKVASYLCYVDPGQFEPEEGHELHGDIEYYYIIHVGADDGKPSWGIHTYKVRGGKLALSPESVIVYQGKENND